MSRSRLAALLVLSLALAASAAQAQYRAGEPAVLPAPSPADPNAPVDASLAAFARWNAAAGRPRLLIFWNRALTDETTTRLTEKTTETEETRHADTKVGETTSTRFGEASKEDDEGIQKRVLTRETGAVATTGGRYSEMKASTSDLLESVFLNAFAATGANLVDREALIRRASVGKSADERGDLQALESEALAGGVDYLIEILPAKNDRTPTGLLFTVKIKQIATSILKAQFQTPAAPPPGPARFVAVQGGFQRQSVDRTTPSLVAVQLASETMLRLAN